MHEFRVGEGETTAEKRHLRSVLFLIPNQDFSYRIDEQTSLLIFATWK